jgi:CheY-like chemotaxis protein
MEQHIAAGPSEEESGDAEESEDFLEDTRITNRLMAKDRRQRRVALVIDDSQDAQELFGEALADAGYRVVSAHDGNQALDILIDMPHPAVIVLDIVMPGMDGLKLLDLMSSYSRLRSLPVLVVTASDEDVPLNIPFGKCLRKPVDNATLVGALDELLALKESGA